MVTKVIPDALSGTESMVVAAGEDRWVRVGSSSECGLVIRTLTPEDALALAAVLIVAADEAASVTLN